VKDEFCKERGLKPFKILLAGQVCTGKSFFSGQLAKHYGVPHIHKDQVLDDIEHWYDVKEAEYNFRQSEKKRLEDLAEARRLQAIAAEEEAKKAEAERLEEEKRRRREELGEDASEAAPEEDAPVEDDPPEEPVEGDADAAADGEGGEGEGKAEQDAAQAKYEKQLAQLAIDEADSEDEFVPLDIKTKIKAYSTEHPDEKEISSDLLAQAFRWRLSQNDCQNRGYVLDGHPISYQTAVDIFFITPPPREKKKPVAADGDDGEDAAPADDGEEEMDPDELKKLMAPKF
jgi:hypothetical protein